MRLPRNVSVKVGAKKFKHEIPDVLAKKYGVDKNKNIQLLLEKEDAEDKKAEDEAKEKADADKKAKADAEKQAKADAKAKADAEKAGK